MTIPWFFGTPDIMNDLLLRGRLVIHLFAFLLMITNHHLTGIFISLTENEPRNRPRSLTQDPREQGNRAGLSTAGEGP